MNTPNERGLWLSRDGRVAIVLDDDLLVTIVDPEFSRARVCFTKDLALSGEWVLVKGAAGAETEN